MKRPSRFSIGVVITVAAICAIGAFGLTMSIRQSTAEYNTCHDMGGRLVDLGKDSICVSEDGRVLTR